MTATRRMRIPRSLDAALAPGLRDIRKDLDLPAAFPPAVEDAAGKAAARPQIGAPDRTDIPFVTIDPPGAMDLDQALHVERRASGFRVHYAIADVAAFVTAGDPVDIEAGKRGETLYGANSRIPLHPTVLSEGAASLLPDQVRPALLWTIDLDRTGEGVAVDVRRARVRSRAKLDYDGVQRHIETGSAPPMWDVLREIGELRSQREQHRGGISLPLPEQEIRSEGGRWRLEYRARMPVEDWNEQISLLAGMAAAYLMIKARVGLLRTLPEPGEWAIARLRRTASALEMAWPAGQSCPDFIRSLDPGRSRDMAMLVACTSMLRGAGYVAFNGTLPAHTRHSALASEYAHVTAPLRRLVDRYAGEVCVALCAAQPLPEWALAALPGLPATMQEADRRANRYERAVIDLAEATVMASQVGDIFDGAVIDVAADDRKQGVVMLRDPAIEARVTAAGDLPLGENVRVRLVEADPSRRVTRFELAG